MYTIYIRICFCCRLFFFCVLLFQSYCFLFRVFVFGASNPRGIIIVVYLHKSALNWPLDVHGVVIDSDVVGVVWLVHMHPLFSLSLSLVFFSSCDYAVFLDFILPAPTICVRCCYCSHLSYC